MLFIAMEKVTNHCDKEYMRMAILKHEEIFREQVYELHRLYEIQKILMKDIVENRHPNDCSQTAGKLCFHVERRPVRRRRRHQETDRDDDLELTLGSKVYNQRKIKAVVPTDDYSLSSFSSSSSSSKQQNWDLDMNLQKQDRVMNSHNKNNNHSPPWLFNALSLNMT